MLIKARVIVVLIAFLAFERGGGSFLDQRVKWMGGNFQWPCVMSRNMFKNSGQYISKNVIATRVAIYEDDVFVALPRLKPGVPATLAKLVRYNDSCEATFVPYPCWSLQEEGTCSALQNVVDLYLDPQNILWILDTGVVNTLEEPVRKCPPKVLAMNVRTGKLLKTVGLSGLTSPASRLQYVVADYSEDGRAFIYVSDAEERAIIVYDVTSGHGHRVALPEQVTTGTIRRDVLYLALLRHSDGGTCLVLTYLSGSRLFFVGTGHLRRGTANGNVHDLGAKPRKMVFLGTDNGGALFFRYEGEQEILRWDSIEAFHSAHFESVYISTECYLATHVAADYRRDSMRVLESNFPDFMMDTVGCGAMQALSFM